MVDDIDEDNLDDDGSKLQEDDNQDAYDGHEDDVHDDHVDDIHADEDDSPDDIETDELPRRSGRVKKKPAWMKNYVCCQQIPQQPEWKEKLIYFQNMASQLTKMDRDMSKAFLKMITEKL
ncbi:neurogenic differentiation factor 1-like [Saccostrea echinata]|uniref:neurogenic differentiation factor 1-like n=1 Tax=Saccostrea echinata TaxID=191078 RepID=UPI002A7F86BA|nr:neurogenic differentiation factor 1-like [Saccostrea echinata]